jgi:hypothetical protein
MYLANWEETVFLFFNVVTMFFVGLNMIRRKFGKQRELFFV